MSKPHQLKMVIVVNSDPPTPLFLAIVIGTEITKYKIKQIIAKQNTPKRHPKISGLSIFVPFNIYSCYLTDGKRMEIILFPQTI